MSVLHEVLKKWITASAAKRTAACHRARQGLKRDKGRLQLLSRKDHIRERSHRGHKRTASLPSCNSSPLVSLCRGRHQFTRSLVRKHLLCQTLRPLQDWVSILWDFHSSHNFIFLYKKQLKCSGGAHTANQIQERNNAFPALCPPPTAGQHCRGGGGRPDHSCRLQPQAHSNLFLEQERLEIKACLTSLRVYFRVSFSMHSSKAH